MVQRYLTLLLLACLSFSTVIAQDAVEELTPKERAEKSPDLQAVQVQQQVKPAFLIQPLVHRLQGRKGQLLKFEFLIEAHDRASRLEIRPVAMMQQENGVIMPDEKAPAPDLIRLTSAASVDLTAAEEHKIMAELRIPVTTAPFLSYGILVREIPLDDQKADGPDNEARVGIRFVTQYLLRVDIDVIGVKGDSVSELKFPDATLVSQEGRCLARVFVENPTDTAMEFSLNCQLIKENTQAVGKNSVWSSPSVPHNQHRSDTRLASCRRHAFDWKSICRILFSLAITSWWRKFPTRVDSFAKWSTTLPFMTVTSRLRMRESCESQKT